MNRGVFAFVFGGVLLSAAAAPKLVLHIDFNTVQLRSETVSDMLQEAARSGYDAILWEIENKVQLDSLPGVPVEEAFTKDEFRGLLKEAEQLGLEPIPLFQTFGHAEYVLSKPAYTNLREQADRYDCYCVSMPEVTALQKKVVAEYLDLFGPKVKWFHLGGDEAHIFATCPVCKARKPMELYAEHLDAVASVLRANGVRPGIWCDMVLKDAYVADLAKVPRDFIIWHWDYQVGAPSAWVCPWTKKLPMARDLGFDVVFSGSSSSYGDTTGVWREAGELQLRQLESYAAMASGATPVPPPSEEVVRHYGREQISSSARNSAAIVLGLSACKNEKLK